MKIGYGNLARRAALQAIAVLLFGVFGSCALNRSINLAMRDDLPSYTSDQLQLNQELSGLMKVSGRITFIRHSIADNEYAKIKLDEQVDVLAWGSGSGDLEVGDYVTFRGDFQGRRGAKVLRGLYYERDNHR